MLVVAIDIGGTFTDLMAFDDQTGRFSDAKSLTTPSHLVQGIIDCIKKSGLQSSAIDELIHGSTTAINTLIERKGAKTGLIVTQGTRDVLTIGREIRYELYDLNLELPKPLVAEDKRLEAGERMDVEGNVVQALAPIEMDRLMAALGKLDIDAVGVCFLHAYVNDAHEKQVEAAIRARFPKLAVSISSNIAREIREFERASTVAANAYVGPQTSEYIAEFHRNLRAGGFEGSLLMMGSHGGVLSTERVRREPIALVESGPVGGCIGAGGTACDTGAGEYCSGGVCVPGGGCNAPSTRAR